MDGSESNWTINSYEFLVTKLYGNPAFFTLVVDVDDHNSSVYILQVCLCVCVCVHCMCVCYIVPLS